MKKMIGLCLIAVLGLSLAACNSETGSSTTDSSSSNTSASSSTTSTSEENVDTGNDNSEEKENNTKKANSTDEIFNEPFSTSATIDETVLWDENDYKVTANSLTYDSDDVMLNLTFENHSDKTLTFYEGSWDGIWCAVNGYMLEDDYLDAEVEPGESVDEILYIPISALDCFGIKEVADIRFSISIEDEEADDMYNLPAVQVTTSAYDSYDFNTDTFEDLVNNGQLSRVTDFDATYTAFDTLYSKNDISMVAEVLAYPQDEEYNDGFPMFYFEMDNQSEYNIFVELSNIYVNGELVEDHVWDEFAMFSDSRLVQGIDIDNLLWLEDDEAQDEIRNTGINNITLDITINNENDEEALSPETVSIDF